MNDNVANAAIIMGIFLVCLWIIGLIYAFIPTIILTFLVFIVGAAFMTSGNGDGRTRND